MQRDLQHPRTLGGGHLSEKRAKDIGVRIAEIRVVESIECIHAKLRVQLLPEFEMLGESDVHVDQTRATKSIAAQGTFRIHTVQPGGIRRGNQSEEHTSELQSLRHLVCRLLLEKK